MQETYRTLSAEAGGKDLTATSKYPVGLGMKVPRQARVVDVETGGIDPQEEYATWL